MTSPYLKGVPPLPAVARAIAKNEQIGPEPSQEDALDEMIAIRKIMIRTRRQAFEAETGELVYVEPPTDPDDLEAECGD